MIRRLGPLLLLAVAGCATTARQTAPTERPANMHEAGLERVMGKTAEQLTALFGPADLDGREGTSRRLQFVGPVCVLDAYLSASGGGVPVVTYVDARLPTGDDIDRASCVAALARRDAAK